MAERQQKVVQTSVWKDEQSQTPLDQVGGRQTGQVMHKCGCYDPVQVRSNTRQTSKLQFKIM